MGMICRLLKLCMSCRKKEGAGSSSPNSVMGFPETYERNKESKMSGTVRSER